MIRNSYTFMILYYLAPGLLFKFYQNDRANRRCGRTQQVPASSQRLNLNIKSFSSEVFRKAEPWSDCPSWKVPGSQIFGCMEEGGVEPAVAMCSPVQAGCAFPLGSAAALQPSPGSSGSEIRWSCWGSGLHNPCSGRQLPCYPPFLWSSLSGRGCAPTPGCPRLGTCGLGCEPDVVLGCIQGLGCLLPTLGPWHPLPDGNSQPPPGSCCRAARVGSWPAGRRSAAPRSCKVRLGLGCGSCGHLSPPR